MANQRQPNNQPNNDIVSILVSIHSLSYSNNSSPNHIDVTIKRHMATRHGDPSDFWYKRQIPLSEIIDIRKAYFSYNFDQMNEFRASDYQRIAVVRDQGDTWEDPFVRLDDIGDIFSALTCDYYVVQVRSDFLNTLRQ